MEKQKEILWVSVIRVFATFSVVWLHTAAPLLYQFNDLPRSHWWVGNIYDSAVRMCFPLFFMLSGYLLLGREEPVKVYFKKRVDKVLIPLVVWSLFYLFWKGIVEHSLSAPFSVALLRLLISPAYYHLWFLYALVGIYLFLPILRIFIQNADKKYLYYFVGLWFSAVAIVPLLERVLVTTSKIDFGMVSGYIGYLVVGYILGRVDFLRKNFWVALIVTLLCVGVTAIGTFMLTKSNQGVYDNYIYAYLSPNVILLSICVFILLKYLTENFRLQSHETFVAAIKLLSSASLGIYFIHPVFLYIFEHGVFGSIFQGFFTAANRSHPYYSIGRIWHFLGNSSGS